MLECKFGHYGICNFWSWKSLKPNASKIHSMQIDSNKIGALIESGGENIKQMTVMTGAQIDIKEDDIGKVVVFVPNEEALGWAKKEIGLVCCEIEQGQIYRGKVTSIKEFRVFVECLPGKEGLAHVSEMADFRVENPADKSKIGDEITAKFVGVDEKIA
jgi:polyribonucleotide nucleotidyltransferase